MIPESFIQDLLNRIDIVDVIDKSVPLKKAGANYSACCPFHNEKSPSFTVSPSKQFYHCFGCGVHGSAISFLMEYEGLSFVDSIHELAKTQGLTVPQTQTREKNINKDESQQLQSIMQTAADYYKQQLKTSPRAIDYLKNRGLTGKIAAKYQIGYAPEGWQNLENVYTDYSHSALTTAGLVVQNDQGRRYDRFRDRIMFPIHNLQGQVIGFGGRVINPDDTPKYYNSPETPLFQKGHELYGLFSARRSIRAAEKVLVVEGYMDVVALAQYEIDYAVASLGTATTPFHITKLKRQTNNIVFCFDGDQAGKTAAWRAVNNALDVLTDDLKLSFLFLPEDHDPDSYVREVGKTQFETEISQAMPLSEFIIKHLRIDNPLATQEDNVRFLNDAEPILQAIKAPRSALYLRKKFAELANLTLEEMQSLMKLPYVSRKPQQSPRRNQSNRQTLSLSKRFCLLMILQPQLTNTDDLNWVDQNDQDGQLIEATILTCSTHPTSKPAAILHALADNINPAHLQALSQALTQFDDDLDLPEELNGARAQLKRQMTQHQQQAQLAELSKKPLSQLSQEERELLIKLSGNFTHKNT